MNATNAESKGRAPAANKPAQIVWFEYVVTDLKRSASFYGALLGWKFAQLDGFPGQYLALTNEVGSMSGGLALADDKRVPGGGSAVYAGVADLEMAVDHAERLGGTVIEPPITIEAAGTFAVIADPDGNHVGLFQL